MPYRIISQDWTYMVGAKSTAVAYLTFSEGGNGPDLGLKTEPQLQTEKHLPDFRFIRCYKIA